MEPLRWVLLLLGAAVLALVFAHSRGWIPNSERIRAWLAERRPAAAPQEEDEPAEPQPEEPEPEPPKPTLSAESFVVTVRILPEMGSQFPAEELILALRAAGLRHGEFKIFHRMSEDEERIRYSVASLVEPGSFDLSNLADSEYKGISVFMLLPAPEDGVALFDEMVGTARAIAKQIEGRLVDEEGGALSMQRERYMREEVIEFLRLQQQAAIKLEDSTDD